MIVIFFYFLLENCSIFIFYSKYIRKIEHLIKKNENLILNVLMQLKKFIKNIDQNLFKVILFMLVQNMIVELQTVKIQIPFDS